MGLCLSPRGRGALLRAALFPLPYTEMWPADVISPKLSQQGKATDVCLENDPLPQHRKEKNIFPTQGRAQPCITPAFPPHTQGLTSILEGKNTNKKTVMAPGVQS